MDLGDGELGTWLKAVATALPRHVCTHLLILFIYLFYKMAV